ncbi:unnamed protein product [Microthlaspi erraticum]|uniref:glucan endo-1,3-beta-D-glucosidase n=1 Tax=Microthlaspi erraticum TaxID=1685480 RepID=A0A6D2L084_9BRAS|nr:unnamed protein product [Microthlaspi erraticum]CAA7059016.1 unnamed protein product [Microthlaspi erraticum]
MSNATDFADTRINMDCPKKSFLLMISCMALLLNNNNNEGFVDAATNLGLNYGLLGDNLPPPNEVINLYKSIGITNIRIFDTNTDVLNALRGNRDIGVIVGVQNQDLEALAVSEEAVNTWFVTNIEPYLADVNITFISVGNEVIPWEIGSHVLSVMQSLTDLVKTRSLPILISTTVAMYNLGASYPPSAGEFTTQAREQLVPVLKYLSQTSTPILVTIYPYFAYASDPANILLDYAIFNTDAVVVQDGPLGYSNMFDVMFDAFLWAMEREGVKDLPMVVAETGWPSAGKGNGTTPEIAAMHNGNFVKHVVSGKGTPKRPNSSITGFLFATFNENLKSAGTEQNYGLYDPTNMKPIYKLF